MHGCGGVGKGTPCACVYEYVYMCACVHMCGVDSLYIGDVEEISPRTDPCQRTHLCICRYCQC